MVTARILAFGSRTLTDAKHPEARRLIREGLKVIKAQAFFAEAELHHGDCEGADRMFAQEWTALGGIVVAHPAQWSFCVRTCKPGHRRPRGDGTTFCPSAGFRRNKEMVALAPQLGVKAQVGDSPGTAMTAKLCEAAGIHVVDILSPTVRYTYEEAV